MLDLFLLSAVLLIGSPNNALPPPVEKGELIKAVEDRLGRPTWDIGEERTKVWHLKTIGTLQVDYDRFGVVTDTLFVRFYAQGDEERARILRQLKSILPFMANINR